LRFLNFKQTLQSRFNPKSQIQPQNMEWRKSNLKNRESPFHVLENFKHFFLISQVKNSSLFFRRCVSFQVVFVVFAEEKRESDRKTIDLLPKSSKEALKTLKDKFKLQVLNLSK